MLFAPRRLLLVCSLLLSLLCSVACYRAPIAQHSLAPVMDYGKVGYDALGENTGTLIVVDPRYGRILKRVARGMDAQFSTSPFEVAQIVTAYAALDAGSITAQTKFPCNSLGENVDLTDALARPCPAYFAEVSKRVPPVAFKRAAQAMGFTYYGTEQISDNTKTMRPINAIIPVNIAGADYEALATRGVGMQANDLHFAQLAISLASSTTTSERMATIITTTSQAITPPTVSVNKQALESIKHGLRKSVEEGSAMAAGIVKQNIAGKVGSDDENALFISFAPSDNPQIAVVVFLHEGTGTQAAAVAGKFYKAYFSK